MTDSDLSRFVERHGDFAAAFDEIVGGRKRTHWMWYIFPQVAGLGSSPMARRFAIESAPEAVAFLNDPVLGGDYVRIVEAVWQQVVEGGVSVRALFGSPDDAKLVSSLTLFQATAQELLPRRPELASFVGQAADILDAASKQGLPRCAVTEAFLSQQRTDGL
ncbi:MAG: hypothetical protein JWL70_1302 [Acidimicrobiia bacterium]|nr:hypothetical protein [Acidimicrobiia bacterium]